MSAQLRDYTKVNQLTRTTVSRADMGKYDAQAAATREALKPGEVPGFFADPWVFELEVEPDAVHTNAHVHGTNHGAGNAAALLAQVERTQLYLLAIGFCPLEGPPEYCAITSHSSMIGPGKTRTNIWGGRDGSDRQPKCQQRPRTRGGTGAPDGQSRKPRRTPSRTERSAGPTTEGGLAPEGANAPIGMRAPRAGQPGTHRIPAFASWARTGAEYAPAPASATSATGGTEAGPWTTGGTRSAMIGAGRAMGAATKNLLKNVSGVGGRERINKNQLGSGPLLQRLLPSATPLTGLTPKKDPLHAPGPR